MVARLHDWCGQRSMFRHPTGEVGAAESGQWWYENPDTGVFFSVDYEPPETDEGEDIEPESDFDGFTAAGIDLNISFARPHFFGLEVVPVIVSLAESLGCAVLDPQGSEQPEDPDADSLIGTWNQGNEFGRRIVLEQSSDYPRWSREASRQWWEYQRGKRQLEDELADDIFVPTLSLVTLPGGATVRSAAAWNDESPFLLPPCDLLIAPRVVRKLLRKKRIEHVFQASEVRRAWSALLEPLAVEGSTFDLMSAGWCAEGFRLLQSVTPLGSIDIVRDRGVAADGFVEC